jgi:hypothetical protein
LVFNQIKTKLHFVGTTEDFITPVKSKIIQNENVSLTIPSNHIPLRKESLNGEGQQFHQYQQNEQPSLLSNH